MGIRASRCKRPETQPNITNTGSEQRNLPPASAGREERRKRFKNNESHYDDIEFSCTDDVREETDTAENEYFYMPKLRTQSDEKSHGDEALINSENNSEENNDSLFGDLCQHAVGLSLHEWFELIKTRNGCMSRRSSDSTCTCAENDNHERDSEFSAEFHEQHSESVFSKEYIIQQTVEACRSLFVDCLRVTEVLPYLLFLDDIEVIKAKERESPKQAAGLLLDQLRASNEVGKWTTFLNALNFTGYQYLASMVNGNTIFDISKHKNLLQVFTPQIVTSLLPSDIIHHLYEKNVISSTDLEEIECELRNRGSTIASLMLLDRIPRRHPNWYSEFLNVLRACHFDFIADTLDVTEQDRKPKDVSVLEFDALVQECAAKPDDWSYITPTYASSEQNPIPPPVPKRPQLHRNTSLYNRRSMPSPQCSSSSSRTDLCVRSSSVLDFINEKKRLALELIDIKEKSRLDKEIKALVKEHEMTVKEGKDENDVHTCERIVEASVKKSKLRKLLVTDADLVDKATQVETNDYYQCVYSPTDTESKESGNPTTHPKKELNREQMKTDILDSVKTQIYEEVKLALGISMIAKGTHKYKATDQSARDPVQKIEIDLAAALPKSHVLLENQSTDSGLCSDC